VDASGAKEKLGRTMAVPCAVNGQSRPTRIQRAEKVVRGAQRGFLDGVAAATQTGCTRQYTGQCRTSNAKRPTANGERRMANGEPVNGEPVNR
jgi:hypothetical protein